MESLLLIQYLQINPDSVISFEYQPKRYLTSSIKLTNLAPHSIAFKIKTNAPFSYLVKPRLGIINPNNTKIIDITMQPTDYDSCRMTLNDKFLINVCPIGKHFSAMSITNQDFNELVKNTPIKMIQSAQLKVDLVFEQSELHDNSVDTRDTSGCESSPAKNENLSKEKKLEKISTLKFLESFDRQFSDKGDLDTSFQSFLDDGQTKNNDLKMMLKCQSASEIPLQTFQNKFQYFERQISAVNVKDNNLKNKTENFKKVGELSQFCPNKLQEEKKQLKEGLNKFQENISKIKNKKLSLKIKEDHLFLLGLVVALIGVLLGMFKPN